MARVGVSLKERVSGALQEGLRARTVGTREWGLVAGEETWEGGGPGLLSGSKEPG